MLRKLILILKARLFVVVGILAMATHAYAQIPPPDAQKLNAFLAAGEVAALDAVLAPYQEAYRKGVIGETAGIRGIRDLRSNDRDLRVSYDKWVSEYPQSYSARVARARYLVRLGYLARGSAYVSATSKAQFDAMYALFNLAQEDLEVALTLDAKPTLVHAERVTIAMATGDEAAVQRALVDATELDSAVVSVLREYLHALRPEWGGSIEEMESAVARWRDSVGEVEAAAFGRVIDDAKASALLQAGTAPVCNKQHYREAIAFYDQVIAQAPVARAYSWRGYCHVQFGDDVAALKDFNHSLEIDPENWCCYSWMHAHRGKILIKQGLIEKGITDLVAAADADDAWAATELAVMYAFGKRGVKINYSVARRWCERAAKQGDGLSMYCMGGLYLDGLGVPKDIARAAKWFESAAIQGIDDAQADYAFMLWNGQGVTSDHDAAIHWWLAAAKQNNQRAKTQLESHFSTWEYFREVTFPDWVATLKQRLSWLYSVLYFLGSAGK